MADKKEPESSQGYGKGYGKRPLWQWILIYAVIGGLIYYLIYYFAFRNRGYNSGSKNYQSQSY